MNYDDDNDNDGSNGYDENIIPRGKYKARVCRVEGEDGDPLARWGTAGEKNTTQVLMYFRVEQHPAWDGTVIPWFGFFSTKAWQRTVQSLRYCGFKGDDLEKLNDQELDELVEIDVSHEESSKNPGRFYPRVNWVNKIGAGAIKLNNPLGEGELRMFSAKMKNYTRQVPEVASAEEAPAPAPAARSTSSRSSGRSASGGKNGWGKGRDERPPPPADDDIPF